MISLEEEVLMEMFWSTWLVFILVTNPVFLGARLRDRVNLSLYLRPNLFQLFTLTATPLTKAASVGESLTPLRPYTELM